MRYLSRVVPWIAGCALIATFPVSALSQVVHVVYLVPADRAVREDYRAALEIASRDAQWFYQSQLGAGRTFRLDPSVIVLRSTRNAAWFSTNVGPGGSNFNTFYANVRDEVEALLGLGRGRIHGGPDVYAITADAHHACGQCGGCGSNRVIVGARNDFRSLVGESFQPVCPTDYGAGPRCPGIGGMSHELGHAFGLPHPPGCDAGLPTCDRNGVMWQGWALYPQTYFRAEETNFLLSTSYITTMPPLSPAAVCGPVPPAPPRAFGASVSGNAVELTWNVADEGGAPTAYTLRAGSAPGLSNIASVNITGPTTSFYAVAPAGVYYLNLTATNRFGSSAPANEITVAVGQTALPPGAPMALSVVIDGSIATLSWMAPAGAPTGYVLEAGTAPGATNLASLNLGPQTSFISLPLPPGSYFVRVKAVSAGGVGPASNEALITVPAR